MRKRHTIEVSRRGQRGKVDVERESFIQGGSNVGQSGGSMTVGDGRDGRDVAEYVLMTMRRGSDGSGDEGSGARK